MLLLIAGVLSISHNPAATVTHYTAPTGKVELVSSRTNQHSAGYYRWRRRQYLRRKRLKSLHQFPPHHRLWVCIHSNEGPWHDTSSPYYGGLQMHANWYGLGNAGYYSESKQEWTAERAYKNSGYSYSFLYGQWFEWDNADYCARYR